MHDDNDDDDDNFTAMEVKKKINVVVGPGTLDSPCMDASMSLSLACKEKLLIFEWPLKEEMKFLPWLEQRNEAESYYHGHGER